MHYNGRIMLLSHCILNNCSKVKGFEYDKSLVDNVVKLLLDENMGLLQLPCPELTLYGAKRWGHVKEQFDNPFFREHCRKILAPIIAQLIEYQSSHYQLCGVLGIDGSPSCGINMSCSGNWGGELSDSEKLTEAINSLTLSSSMGVFMEELLQLTKAHYINIPFIGLYELDPSEALEKINRIIKEDKNGQKI